MVDQRHVIFKLDVLSPTRKKEPNHSFFWHKFIKNLHLFIKDSSHMN